MIGPLRHLKICHCGIPQEPKGILIINPIGSYLYLLTTLDRTAYRWLTDFKYLRQVNSAHPHFSVGKIVQQVAGLDPQGLFTGAQRI